MIQLQAKAPLIAKLLGEQIYDSGKKYKKASFVFEVYIRNRQLLYNVFTKELLLLDKKGVEEEFLVKNWFLIPVEQKEYELIDPIKNFMGITHSQKSVVKDYTIFTTTDCNARCSYCFENGLSKIRMTDDIIMQTINFIKKHYDGQTVKIHWFGGEPLYNVKAINVVSKELLDAGIRFRSIMTTNGYLFSEKMVEKAKNEWNLENVQITLDGTENKYNQIKNYIYKTTNPFARVISNIGLLLEKKIIVKIRLNLSLENADDLFELTRCLINNYGHYRNLSIYPIPLFELIKDDENRRGIFEKLEMLQNLISRHSLNIDYAYFKKIRVNHCKADNGGNSIVIFPDGNVGLCEHEWESVYIGNLSSEEFDQSVINEWRKYNQPMDKCKHCLFYADCVKLSLCNTNNFCNEELVDFDKLVLRDTIRKVYKKYEAEI